MDTDFGRLIRRIGMLIACPLLLAGRAQGQGPAQCPVAMLTGDVTTTRLRALGAILARRGRYAEALACWQDVIRSLPNDDASHFNSGMMDERLGDYASAESEFETAHRLRPSNTHAVWHLGLTNLKLGRDQVALQWFLQAANADSADVYAWEGASRAASQLGQDSLAAAYHTRAVAMRSLHGGSMDSARAETPQ